MDENCEITPQPLQLSIVLEWENARLAELDRTRKMLRALDRDLSELISEKRWVAFGPQELLVMFDEELIQEDFIRSVIHSELGSNNPRWQLRFITARGGQKHYYHLKNIGAQQANGDLLLFIDSDVIPELGWLAAMVTPFGDPDVQVVSGNCYVEPYNLYASAFALFWFFPLRAEPGKCYEVDDFFANNIAFRRSTFLAHSFPDMPEGVARGSCTLLAQELVRNDIKLWRTTSAQVAHPPPSTFTKKALSNGRDRGLRRRAANCYGFVTATRWLASHLWSSFNNIRKNYREVGLTAPKAFVAMMLSAIYGLLSWCGECCTVLAPKYMAAILNEF